MSKKSQQADKAGAGAEAGARLAGGKPESIARKVYSSVAAIAAGAVARKVVEKAWVKATGKTPPQDPHSPSVRWTEAVGWSVASGTTVAVARLLATRKAAGAWERVSAQDSPESDPERSETATRHA